MKCISLHQPWASLIVLGEKRFETRSWATKHRGPLLIHAAKKRSGELIAITKENPFFEALHRGINGGWRLHGSELFDTLPLGCIIGKVEMVECYKVYVVHEPGRDVAHMIPDSGPMLSVPDGNEFSFGDFAHGRYAWLLKDPVRFAEPIPYRGMQGIFDVDMDACSPKLGQAVNAAEGVL